ncbi:MAG: methyltransferase domain-containing protein [Candidatus Paceibacterota bacterium]
MGDYDKISKEYKAYGKKATTDWELGHKTVAGLLEPIKGKKILDYGCGNGKFSIYLAQQGASVVGVDVSAHQLEIAEQDTQNSVVYLLESEHPEIETQYADYFDDAVLNFVLCEISSQEEIIKVLKRIHSLLKTGGKLVILNPNWDRSNGKDFMTHQMVYVPELKPGCRVITLLKGNPPINIPDYYWPKQNYLDMLKEAGFGNPEILEPLAPNDGRGWKDEKESPPFLIIKTDKVDGSWNKLFSHDEQELTFGKAKIIVNNGVFTCDPNITYSSSMIIDNLKDLSGLRVADIGTGSGVISVIAALLGAKKVIATDISEKAIENASLNVLSNEVENVVKIVKTNIFDGIEGKFDVITANLPILDEVWSEQGVQVESTLEQFLKQAKSFLETDGIIYLPWGSFADKEIIESLIKKYNYTYKVQSVDKLGFTWYLYILS